MIEPREPKQLGPRTLFLATLGSVFLVELLIMLLLPLLPVLTPVFEAFLDAVLLSVVVLPFLYHFFFKPLHRNIRRREQAEIEREKSQELSRMKSEFISLASHELRTPLAAISGYSELLLADAFSEDPRRQEFIEVIHRKAATLERLIDDLLDLGRIESGRPLQIEPQRCDIVALVDSVARTFRENHADRRCEIDLPATPVYSFLDKVRIEQVLDNLLTNVVKFSPPETPVEIEGTLQGDRFQVRVSDGGIGMSPDEVERIFDKFYRADTPGISTPGIGLGMTIVKEIVELHGGNIRVDSRKGEGTTVRFILPVVP